MEQMIAFIRALWMPLRHASLPRIRLRPALFAAVACLLPFAVVQAHHVEDKCTRSDTGKATGDVVIPATVNIGRDAQVGDAIGPWFKHEITWTCIRKAVPAINGYEPPDDRFQVKTDIIPLNTTDAGMFGADPSFRVYSYLGFGMIFKVTHGIEGGPETVTPVNTIPGGYITTTFEDTVARQHGDISRFYLKLEVQLVKLTNKPKNGKFLPIIINFHTTSRHPGTEPYWKHHSHVYHYLQATVNNINAACTTPDVNVPLGDAHSGNLQNVGDFGPTKNFYLRFENCPDYMHSVAYRFQSVPLQAISNGILPLDASLSTASGVGVQVMNPDETPLVFGSTFIPLADYDAFNPLPLYEIPLKARIIRTPGDLQGGDVHAAMKMLVRYR